MQPIPCNHCGFNFMRQTIDPEAPRLCNSCAIREEKRSPTKKDTMQTIDIVIKCPVTIQADIEEYCINQGMDFSKYFLSLHQKFKDKSDAVDQSLMHSMKSSLTGLEKTEIKAAPVRKEYFKESKGKKK